MKNIIALILAGGKSKRFWPLSDKNLINFTEGNLLEHHLNTLSSLGIKDFIIVCSPEVAAFLRVKGKNYSNITIHRLLQDNNNQGIGKAVLLASPVIEKHYSGRPVYILNNDDVYNPSIHQDLFTHLLKKKTFMSVVTYEELTYKPFGYFIISENRVKGIIEKPPPNKTPSNLTNMALHLYSDFPKLIDVLKLELPKKDENDDLYERSINILCQKYDVSYLKYTGKWEILKYPWNILSVSQYFLSLVKQLISEKATVDKMAKISGPVIIEDEVKILEFARIVGPTVIKKGTIVGTGSLVRESIIGENCVIGYHTEITRSYVGSNCWFHTNYVGDSVLNQNVNMGAGAVLANLRLDQKNIFSVVNKTKIDTQRTKLGSMIGSNVQIGVNSSIMPGVKIGKNSVVGPGIILNDDLNDNTMAFSQNQILKKNRDIITNPQIRKQFRDLLKL